VPFCDREFSAASRKALVRRGFDEVEFAPLGYIDWFNHRGPHGEIGEDNSYVSAAESEAVYYRQTEAVLEEVAQRRSRSQRACTHRTTCEILE
jgi:hypothetical protein